MDRELWRRLKALNALPARRSSDFVHFGPIGGRFLELSDPALLKRLGHTDCGWTGREQNWEEMLAAFGL